jgi:putative ABC transport system permease protein
MKSYFLLAWRNLFRSQRRTLASLITVGFGSAGLLIFQGFNTGVMNQYRENTVRGYYGYGQIFHEGYYQKVLEKPWENWISDATAIEAKIKTIPEVKEVYPRLGFYAFLTKGGVTLGGRGEGVDSKKENLFFTQLNITEGHNLESEDQILIGKGLAESLGAIPGDTVTVLTQTIHGQINGLDLVVAGVSHTGIKAIDDKFFRIGLPASQRLLDTDKVELFSLATTGVEAWPKVEAGVRALGLSLESVSFDVLDKVYYQNSVNFLKAQYGFIRLIVLLVVALGIFNTIAVGLIERSGEVGALRANGESRSRLRKIFFLETGLLGLIGGTIGVVIAIAIDRTLLAKGVPMPPGPGITRSYMVMLEILPEHIIQAILLPVLTTLASSVWPIHKLLRRSIPDLLRST